jgi:hypothetical protein
MGFLQDSKGNSSIMRLAFAWLMVNATAMGWYALVSSGVAEAATIFGTISGVATGLKIMQNQQEK